MAYCNEKIYIEDTAHSESFRRSGEPEPMHVPDLKEVLKAYDIQKIVFAGEDDYLRVCLHSCRIPGMAGSSWSIQHCSNGAGAKLLRQLLCSIWI